MLEGYLPNPLSSTDIGRNALCAAPSFDFPSGVTRFMGNQRCTDSQTGLVAYILQAGSTVRRFGRDGKIRRIG